MPDRTPNLNFLPPAYVASRRHWRWAQLQVTAVLLLAVGLSLGVVRMHSEFHRANGELSAFNQEVASARADQQKLESLTQLKDQWRRQDRLLSSAGTHIEASRLLMALERVIPADTVLTDLSLELLNQNENHNANSVGGSDTSPLKSANDASAAPRDLKVTLRGLAPGEVSIGNLLASLSKAPVFQHVNLTYAQDGALRGSDRAGREFEVTFQISLSPGGEVASTTADAN